MAIYKLTKDALLPLEVTELSAEHVLERKDLQRLLRSQIGALDPDLMVIGEEFSQWADSTRRIDLLCIDKEANLVVVELKRSEDGGHMELQAIRYAAMISTLSFSQLVEAHRDYLGKLGHDSTSAEASILTFLEWEQPDEDSFANQTRIVLAAADFSRELTTSVLWLNDQGLDLRCVRLKPYRDDSGQIFLEVQQLIPLPEAADYQTQIKAKGQIGRVERAERHELRFRWWSDLLRYASTQTQLHAGRSPGITNSIGGRIGRGGFELNYVVTEGDSRVELYINQSDEAANLNAFNELHRQKEAIEKEFGGELEWQELPNRQACRIRKVVRGGYRSPEPEWPTIHQELVRSMIDLDRAIRPFVHALP